jgi:serine/threonine-protein kinase
VPQLRGKTIDDAQAALRAVGLGSTVVGVNENVDKNVVVRQMPDAGALLPPGGSVTIVVGTGSTAIPAVTNLPRDQAVATLQNSSFKVTVVNRRDPRIPAGVAIGTNPPAGSVVPRGSAVELNLSSGR